MGGYIRVLNKIRYVYFTRRKDGKIENICCGRLGAPKTEETLLRLHDEQTEAAVASAKARSAQTLAKLRRQLAELEENGKNEPASP